MELVCTNVSLVVDDTMRISYTRTLGHNKAELIARYKAAQISSRDKSLNRGKSLKSKELKATRTALLTKVSCTVIKVENFYSHGLFAAHVYY